MEKFVEVKFSLEDLIEFYEELKPKTVVDLVYDFHTIIGLASPFVYEDGADYPLIEELKKKKELSGISQEEIKLYRHFCDGMRFCNNLYVSQLNIPDEIKSHVHSDKPFYIKKKAKWPLNLILKKITGDITYRVEPPKLFFSWLKKHPEKNISIKINDELKQKLSDVYERIKKLATYYNENYNNLDFKDDEDINKSRKKPFGWMNYVIINKVI